MHRKGKWIRVTSTFQVQTCPTYLIIRGLIYLFSDFLSDTYLISVEIIHHIIQRHDFLEESAVLQIISKQFYVLFFFRSVQIRSSFNLQYKSTKIKIYKSTGVITVGLRFKWRTLYIWNEILKTRWWSRQWSSGLWRRGILLMATNVSDKSTISIFNMSHRVTIQRIIIDV